MHGDSELNEPIWKDQERVRNYPRDYTYTEARSLLIQMGFEEYNKGKTSGSRVKFYRSRDKKVILLHKPHPGDIMKIGTVRDLVDCLKEIGEL